MSYNICTRCGSANGIVGMTILQCECVKKGIPSLPYVGPMSPTNDTTHLTLRFVEGGGWDSKIIRWDTRCKWSHVEFYDEFTGVTLGAMLDGGIKRRMLCDSEYRHTVSDSYLDIHVTPYQFTNYKRFLDCQLGKPYDWRAIVSFGLGQRDWREDDSWFCSELQARGLEVAGILKLPDDIPVWRITPRDLWVLVAGMHSGK